MQVIWSFFAGIGDIIRFGWFLSGRDKTPHFDSGIHQDWQMVAKDVRRAVDRQDQKL